MLFVVSFIALLAGSVAQDCGSCHIEMFGSPGMCIEVSSPYECTDATNPSSVQSQVTQLGIPLPVIFKKDSFCSTETEGECALGDKVARLYNTQFNSFCAAGVEPKGTYPEVTSCSAPTTAPVTVPTTLATVMDCGSCHIEMFGSPGMCIEVSSPYECTDATNPSSVQSQVTQLGIPLPVKFMKDSFCSTETEGECALGDKVARLYNSQFNSFCAAGVEPKGTYPEVTSCNAPTTAPVTVPTTLATTMERTTRPMKTTRPMRTTQPMKTTMGMEEMEPELEPERPVTMPHDPEPTPDDEPASDPFPGCGDHWKYLSKEFDVKMAMKVCRMRGGGCPLRCKKMLKAVMKAREYYNPTCRTKEMLTYFLKMKGMLQNPMEMGCFDDTCGPDEMACMRGGCVEKHEWCDGVPDCKDGSDEKFCACTMPTMQCPESIVAAHCGPIDAAPSGGCTNPRCPGKSYEELMELGCTMKENPDCKMGGMPPKEDDDEMCMDDEPDMERKRRYD